MPENSENLTLWALLKAFFIIFHNFHHQDLVSIIFHFCEQFQAVQKLQRIRKKFLVLPLHVALCRLLFIKNVIRPFSSGKAKWISSKAMQSGMSLGEEECM